MVINSAYWLVGRGGWIAAGPAKPIKLIDKTTENVIKVLVLVGLPLLVVCLGGAVLYLRRR